MVTTGVLYEKLSVLGGGDKVSINGTNYIVENCYALSDDSLELELVTDSENRKPKTIRVENGEAIIFKKRPTREEPEKFLYEDSIRSYEVTEIDE